MIGASPYWMRKISPQGFKLVLPSVQPIPMEHWVQEMGVPRVTAIADTTITVDWDGDLSTVGDQQNIAVNALESFNSSILSITTMIKVVPWSLRRMEL